MFSLTKEEIGSLRILVAIPIVFGIFYSLFNDSYVSISNLAAEEMKRINFSSNAGADVILKSLSITGGAGEVFINSAGFDELLKCPGIGPVTANLIIEERTVRKFDSWEDFAKRVKGFGPVKLENLKSSGVRIDAE